MVRLRSLIVNKAGVVMPNGHRQRILSSIWAAAGGLAIVLGILTGLPSVIKDAIANGPAVLQNANVWWVLIILGIEAAIIRAIWSRPQATGRFTTHAGMIPEGVSVRAYLLAELLEDGRQFRQQVLNKPEIESEKQENKNVILSTLYHSFTVRLKTLIGDKAQAELNSVLNHIHTNTTSVRLIVETGCRSLETIVLRELDKEGYEPPSAP